MEFKKDERGWARVEFKDVYGHECSIQKSSAAEYDAIWLGINDANPQIMESKVKQGGTGWVKYSLNEDVLLTTRMHLNIDQAKDLIKLLEIFVETGEVDLHHTMDQKRPDQGFNDFIHGCNLILYHRHGCMVEMDGREDYRKHFDSGLSPEDAVKIELDSSIPPRKLKQ